MLRVAGLLEGEPTHWSRIQSALEQIFVSASALIKITCSVLKQIVVFNTFFLNVFYNYAENDDDYNNNNNNNNKHEFSL